MAAEHDDISVDHRHAETLILRFSFRLGIGIREEGEKRDVGTQAEKDEVLGARTKRLSVLREHRAHVLSACPSTTAAYAPCHPRSTRARGAPGL